MAAGHRSDESVAAAGQRLDEPRHIGRVPERIAQPANGSIQAVLEIDECLRRPQSLPQLLAGDEFAGTIQQRLENLKRLIGEIDPDAGLPQLARAQIQLETRQSGREDPAERSFRISVVETVETRRHVTTPVTSSRICRDSLRLAPLPRLAVVFTSPSLKSSAFPLIVRADNTPGTAIEDERPEGEGEGHDEAQRTERVFSKSRNSLIVSGAVLLTIVPIGHVVVSGQRAMEIVDQAAGESGSTSASKRNEGRRLFRKETFGGNGRTCETCHSRSTGTLSPDDVQERLDEDPNDPLFLHDGLDDGVSGTVADRRTRHHPHRASTAAQHQDRGGSVGDECRAASRHSRRQSTRRRWIPRSCTTFAPEL